MNKKLLLVGTLLIAGLGLIFKDSFKGESEVEKLRKQHAEFLNNHPYQKTAELPKKERKAQGLPPNAYFEQKYLSEINPNTGRTGKQELLKLQEDLNKNRTSLKTPGEVDNVWVERGPDNVGGRTRAVIFDPNDATNETVFAGGVSGGLWKNTNISNPDSRWVRIGIPENLAVSSIVVDPNDSKIFYVGTGESYVNGDVNGDGLWKSTDAGNTWTKIFGGVTGSSFLDANSKVTVNSPSEISGDYISILTTNFGADITSSITNDLVLVDDGSIPKNDGCQTIINSTELNGKIAVILRGGCNFTAKVKNAQEAGAVAVVVVNNVNTNPINMAGTDSTINIPSVMVSKSDGDKLISSLASGSVNVTLSIVDRNALNSTIVPGIQHINDLVIRNNSGTSEIYVAAAESAYTTGGVSLGGDSFGLYKSTNGVDFVKLDLPKTDNGNDYEPNNIKVSADNSLYLSTTRSFTFGDGGGVIMKSTDGTSFTKVYTLPNGLRTEIAPSPTNDNTVYVLAQMSTSGAPVKIIKTTDNFSTVTDLALPNDADNGIPANDFTRGQSFYDLLLRVDPNNENILYVGGIDLFKSTDGGSNWNQISKWSNNNNLASLSVPLVHADQHGLAFASSDRMVFSNDGGVYFSNNAGVNIDARNNNYNTLQFYTVGVAPTSTFGGKEYFLAGAQDNGTQLVQEAEPGINSSLRVFGGDGAASFFDLDGSDQYIIVNFVYNQSIYLFNFKTSSWIEINDEDSSNGDFINQEELDSNLNILYSNYSSGNSTFRIRRYSNILEENNIEKTLLFNSLMDAEPSTLKISPFTTTSSTMFVGLKNGKVLKVENANNTEGTWTNITGENFVGSVSDIEFGKNENEIFVTMHNYGVVSVWYSENGGASWVNKEGNLPDIPVKSLLQNPLSSNEVIIGTDLGVWKTSNFKSDTPNWVQSSNGMSNVPVLDLDLRDDNVVFAATYGRGVFSGKFTSDPNGDNDNDGVLNKDDNCPDTPNTDQADSDGNGIGDVCQDSDGDGVIDTEDNCPNNVNPDQKDSDGNGVGDACQDTDGDGIFDDKDNCINTPNTDQADVNNNGIGDICDTSYEAQDNISITITSETCQDQNDGRITINVKETFVTYKVTLTGDSKNETKDLTTNSSTFENLEPGKYEICLEVNDRDYTQCFEVNIDEAASISLRVAKKEASKSYQVNINSGTSPYNVYLNGSLIGTYNESVFDVVVEEKGVLEVKTAKACEGSFKTIIDGVFLRRNPIVSNIEFLVPNNLDRNNVDVTVFDLSGKTVLNQSFRAESGLLTVPFESYSSGIYIVKLGIENSSPIKIIK